jgi:DNA repair protein RecN (Recombination protein N)
MVITHQPQVASKADYNILVQKAINDGKTFSSASTLNQDQALREVARMLSGKVITEEALNAAKGLIPRSAQNNPN